MRALFIIALLISTNAYAATIENMKVENAVTPLGIDAHTPRFSWQMQDTTYSARQTHYNIIVQDEKGIVVWDSKRIESDASVNISYGGAPLMPRTRYTWKLTVHNSSNQQLVRESWFETGLMSSNPTAWNGAKWLGGKSEDRVLYADYLPVFQLAANIQIAESTAQASLMYGINDPRLMNKNYNIYGLENAPDSSYIRIVLDISTMPAALHVFRVGYHPNDTPLKPLRSFAVPAQLINENNRYAPHTIYIESVLGNTNFYIDGKERGHRFANIGLNPLGNGGDYVAFPMLASVKCEHGVRNITIRDYRPPCNILAVVNTPNKITNPSHSGMPVLQTEFTIGKNIRKARLYATARGVYELYINGKRVSNTHLAPGSTQYNKTHLYQTYEITEHLSSSKSNTVQAWLGEGWWSGNSTYMGDYWNFFGDRQSFLARIVITYIDGTEQEITTQPDKWQYTTQSPLTYSSMMQGEVYDARNEDLQKAHWQPAVEIDPDSTTLLRDYNKMQFLSSAGDEVYKVDTLTAQSVTEIRKGVFIYDMGQNLAGVPLIQLNGLKAGTKLTLRFAEVLYPALPEYRELQGMIMLENIRAAMAQDIYICKGGAEVINPRFTFHGYRYIEITGIDQQLPLADVRSEVLSSIRDFTAHYETSHTLVNKLWENTLWSARANFLSIPTDCPQRNERLGWSGDISVFAPTATYIADLPLFLRRHMQAMRDTQSDNGKFADVAPLGVGFGDILWGSAGITVAYNNFKQYADTVMLLEHYDAMLRYIGYIYTRLDPKTGEWLDEVVNTWGNLGDWLSPEYNKTAKNILWSAYLCYDLEIMSSIAAILGKQQDAADFATMHAERRRYFNEQYIDTPTGKTAYKGKIIDTQASYAVPLALGVVDEQHRKAFVNNFIQTVERESIDDKGQTRPPYSLMTGFIGTAWISKALSDAGRTDIAYRLLTNESYPSWLYPITQGATTIWERLDSYTHESGFGGNNSMNSFNHYSFGAVCAWLMEYSLGIRCEDDSASWQKFTLAPEPDFAGKLAYARGYYDSPYGRIESRWEREGDAIRYEFVIPANTTAEILLLATTSQSISAKSRAPYLPVYLGEKKGKHLFRLPAGRYTFRCE